MEIKSNIEKIDWTNKENVLNEIKRHSMNFKNASDELKNDIEVVLSGTEINRSNIKYANTRFVNDKETVMEILKHDGYFLNHISANLRNDKEVVLGAIKQNPYSYKFASTRLKNDLEIVLEVAKKDKRVIQEYSPKSVKELVGDCDPEKFLSSHLLSEKLKNQLKEKKISPPQQIKI